MASFANEVISFEDKPPSSRYKVVVENRASISAPACQGMYTIESCGSRFCKIVTDATISLCINGSDQRRPYRVPSEDKEIIVALAESGTGRTPHSTFDDFISGKGQGLNVLLQ